MGIEFEKNVGNTKRFVVDKVEILGKDQYKLGSNFIFDTDFSNPQFDAGLDQLERALEITRNSIKHDFRDLELMYGKGFSAKEKEVKAVVKNILTGYKALGILIIRIKLAGGLSGFSKEEADIVGAINERILAGIKERKKEELKRKEKEMSDYFGQLRELEKFKWLRGQSEKKYSLDSVREKMNKIDEEIKEIKAFIEGKF